MPTTINVYDKTTEFGIYLILQVIPDQGEQRIYTLSERASFPYASFEKVITWLLNPENYQQQIGDFLLAHQSYRSTLQSYLEDGSAKGITTWIGDTLKEGYLTFIRLPPAVPESVYRYIQPMVRKQQRRRKEKSTA
jgi:hypothetical protein